MKKIDSLKITPEQKEELKERLLHREAERLRENRKKINIREFVPLKIIGRGAFGEVRVCRQKSTGEIVAIKKMKKSEMLNKNQLMHVRTEKEILTANNPWIVKLKYSFQDDQFLYLVMSYLPGGDLMNLLMKKDILSEDEARFYTAEMILAVDSVHKLNCIHRDLKPDNILIGKDGHIQLSDFGLSKISDKTFFPMSTKDDEITIHAPSKGSGTTSGSNIGSKPGKKRTRLMAYSTVGTPDYIAPEVFGKEGYGPEVDYWSIGVMFFEMVAGYPPFFCENPGDTCKKITKWKQYFTIPNDPPLSNEAKNLILRFVTYPQTRLGVNGIEEIKKHPFFRGIDWDNIRSMTPPFIPQLKNDWDTHYFDQFEEEEPFYPPISKKTSKRRKDVNYPGYTFNRDLEGKSNTFVGALEEIEVIKQNLGIKDNNELEIIPINNDNDEESEGELKDDIDAEAVLNEGTAKLVRNPAEEKLKTISQVNMLEGCEEIFVKEKLGKIEQIEKQENKERIGHINLPRQIANQPLRASEKKNEEMPLEKRIKIPKEIIPPEKIEKEEQPVNLPNPKINDLLKYNNAPSNNTYNQNQNAANNPITVSKPFQSTITVNTKNSYSIKNISTKANANTNNLMKMINSNTNTVGLANKHTTIQPPARRQNDGMPNIIKKLMNIDPHSNAYSNNVINTSPNTNSYNIGGLRGKYEANHNQNNVENKQGEIVTGQLVNKIVLEKNKNRPSKSPPNRPQTKNGGTNNTIMIPKSQRMTLNVPGSRIAQGLSTKEKINLVNKMNFKTETGIGSSGISVRKPQTAYAHYGNTNASNPGFKISIGKPGMMNSNIRKK